MARASFRQGDVTRALKAARAAGFAGARVEFGQDGNVVAVVATDSNGVARAADDEHVLTEFRREHGYS